MSAPDVPGVETVAALVNQAADAAIMLEEHGLEPVAEAVTILAVCSSTLRTALTTMEQRATDAERREGEARAAGVLEGLRLALHIAGSTGGPDTEVQICQRLETQIRNRAK